MANNPIALDFNDLIYYDKKIKQYVDDKADLIVANIPDTYTKAEIDTKLDIINTNAKTIQELKADIAVLKDDRDEAEYKITRIDATLTEIQNLVGNNSTQVAKLQEDVNELENANIIITEKIADIQSSYATEEYVRAKIAEAELADSDVDLSDYYTKSETDQAIQSAINNIPETDLSDYVTNEDFQRVSDQSAANNKLILDIGSELVRIDETLEHIPTKISELENDSNYLTDIPEEYATKEYVTKNYVTTEQVEQVIAKEVTDNTEFQKSIAQGVAEQIETINYGTF